MERLAAVVLLVDDGPLESVAQRLERVLQRVVGPLRSAGRAFRRRPSRIGGGEQVRAPAAVVTPEPPLAPPAPLAVVSISTWRARLSFTTQRSRRTFVNTIETSVPDPPARGPTIAAAATASTAAETRIRTSGATSAIAARAESVGDSGSAMPGSGITDGPGAGVPNTIPGASSIAPG